jgi:hypothetical protein
VTIEVAASSRLAGSTGDEMLRNAIARALQVAPAERSGLFERLLDEIAAAAADPAAGMRPWTYTAYDGTDGSRVFRGGIGLSIVVDPRGRLWRARSYEDFDTTYTITPTSCEIDTLTPRYAEMREYLPGGSTP